jgi:nucleoside-diphosphate-sugar epimerase
VGERLLRYQNHARILVLTSQVDKISRFRALGVTPLLGNLDHPSTLKRLAGLAQRVVHLAPPSVQGLKDERSQALARALSMRSQPSQLIYASTSGVYGDCRGQWVDETCAVQPQTHRAQRRVDAEQQWRWWGRARGVAVSVLRIPGIYALNRPGGSPLERLQRATPVLMAQDDVYTNHIHADDLARAIQRALWQGRPQRIYNINDDTQLLMGDYFDVAADLWGLERPMRMSREQAQHSLPSLLMSFMSESRRMINDRLKRELRFSFQYPTVKEGLQRVT